jgi:hypothetical protein
MELQTRSLGRELCRVCSDDSNQEPLLHPCHCTGSVGAVHAKCLQHWIMVRPVTTNLANDGGVDPRLRCMCLWRAHRLACFDGIMRMRPFAGELCHYPYRVRVQRKIEWSLRALFSWRTCGHLLEIIVLLSLLAIAVGLWPLLGRGSDNDQKERSNQAQQEEWERGQNADRGRTRMLSLNSTKSLTFSAVVL